MADQQLPASSREYVAGINGGAIFEADHVVRRHRCRDEGEALQPLQPLGERMLAIAERRNFPVFFG